MRLMGKAVFAFIFLFTFSVSKTFSVESTITKDSSEVKSFSFSGDSVFSFKSKKGFLPELLHDFGEQATAPFHMTSGQSMMVVGGVVITGALILSDEKIDNYFKPMKEKNRLIGDVSRPITNIGSSYAFMFAGAFGAYGLVCKDRKAVLTMLLCFQAAITSGVWVRVGKMLTSRERPSASYKDFQHDFWWGPFQQFNPRISKDRGVAYFDAFPSGHTATAFSIASVFAHQYSDRAAVPVTAYTIASLVGVSRLTEHDHWASDVFAGACIGYLCGKQVVKHDHEQERDGSPVHASSGKASSFYFLSMSGNQPMVNYVLTF